jgi:hypothetical protein
MSFTWNKTKLTSEEQARDVLTELQSKWWLCRGQSKRYGGLVPSIDRKPRQNLSRLEKLALERQSIELFRSTARFFSAPGEQRAFDDDIVASMVLRHYAVPTRLLDWSLSPWVAAYFAAQGNDGEDGELWSFDEPLYEQEGKKQWLRWPDTTNDGSGADDKFDAKRTAFTADEPPDWIIAAFYPEGFPRQNAQSGAYTMTAQFGRDHAAVIAKLLADPTRHHVYIVSASLKPTLRRTLRERYGIWRGSLFPDSAGAAATAKTVFSDDGV